MTIFTKQDGYRLQQQNYDLKAEIERLRAALQHIAHWTQWPKDTDIVEIRDIAREALGVNEQISVKDTGRYMTQEEIDKAPGIINATEQNAPASKCVAEHMGGKRCVGKCLDPKDCCGTPLEQNAVRKCTACDGTGTIEARDGGATCYACGGSGDQRDCYAHPRVPLSDASGNGSDG